MKTLLVLASLAGVAPNPPPEKTPRMQFALACEFVGDQVSGDERICTYNCLGANITHTVKVTEVCPPTIDR